MSTRYPASQWRTWLSACQQSDLTVVKFCESIGVSVNTYYRWRERLKSEPDDSAPVPVEFIPVSMAADQIEIELPGGSIRSPLGDNHQTETHFAQSDTCFNFVGVPKCFPQMLPENIDSSFG